MDRARDIGQNVDPGNLRMCMYNMGIKLKLLVNALVQSIFHAAP